MNKNLIIRHEKFEDKFVSVVDNLDSKSNNGYIIGIYSSDKKRHKLEKKKLQKMIKNPSEQFKRFLN